MTTLAQPRIAAGAPEGGRFTATQRTESDLTLDVPPLAVPFAAPAAPTELTPGVMDATAVKWFTTGQCHALALALSDRTGWPVVMLRENCDQDCGPCLEQMDCDWFDEDGNEIGDPEDQAECLGTTVAHCLVEMPDGRLLDAYGPRDPEAVCALYKVRTDRSDGTTDGLQRIDARSAHAAVAELVGDEGGYYAPNLQLADQFVDVTLARVAD